MEIYLMRHGEAVSHAVWDGDDATRPLSGMGLARLETVVPLVQKAGFVPELLITSPFKRAKDTAEVLARAWSDLKIEARPQLAAGARIGVYRNVVKEHRDKKSLFFVTHMPDLAHVASGLTGEPKYLDDVRMEPGEIWAFDVGPEAAQWGSGQLMWKRKLSEWK